MKGDHKLKRDLVSQSPIVAFKSRNMLQALGIVYSRIVLPSSDVKGETKRKDLLPHDMELCLSMGVCSQVCRSIEAGRSQLTSMSRMHSKRHCKVEQQERQSSKLRVCRISKHSHEWRDDGQSHSVFQSIYRQTYPVL